MASDYVAIELLKLIKDKPDAILGLATGGTMTDVYPRFSELLSANHVDLANVQTFNLDEYVGLEPEHVQSYHTYMHQLLLIIMLVGMPITFIFLKAMLMI